MSVGKRALKITKYTLGPNDPSTRSTPATRLCLGEPLGALIDCDAPFLTPVSEFAAAED
jgi:hypothetical protein